MVAKMRQVSRKSGRTSQEGAACRVGKTDIAKVPAPSRRRGKRGPTHYPPPSPQPHPFPTPAQPPLAAKPVAKAAMSRASQEEPSQQGGGAGTARKQGCDSATGDDRRPDVFCQQYSRRWAKMAAPTETQPPRRRKGRKAGKASAVSPSCGPHEGSTEERVPAGRTIVGFEIVSPPQHSNLPCLRQTAEGSAIKQEEEDRCTAAQAEQTGIVVRRSHRNQSRRRGDQARRGGHDTKMEAPCMSGLHCAFCNLELLPLTKGHSECVAGMLCSGVVKREPVLSLWRNSVQANRAPPAPCPCPCPWPAGLQADGPHQPESPLLLLVKNTAALQELQRTLLPYTDTGVQTGPCVYNALWDAAECSVTVLQQCRGCVSPQTPGPLSAPTTASAALVLHPREPGRAQHDIGELAVDVLLGVRAGSRRDRFGGVGGQVVVE
ncbi:hypothetical protein ACEWY4_008325 [Coilia grayii]|uniref:Uncharacterized protein n=1 Tax=Coilia grayii TaxID=363190 RepID=A0ABD1KAK4_9TELE